MIRKTFKHDFINMNAGDLMRWLFMIFLFALFSIVCVIGFYIIQFNGVLSTDTEVWGVFGDFVGGTLNPALSFLALIALLLTIILQNSELEATREELKQSREAAQEQVAHFKTESKKSDVYRTIQVLELRLEGLYREQIYFISDGSLRERELYFTLTFASDEALGQIISPQDKPEPKYETKLVRTKSLLMQLNLTIVKLSSQLSMLTEYGENEAILYFYLPTIRHLTNKLDQIGYLAIDDKKSIENNLDLIQMHFSSIYSHSVQANIDRYKT